MERRSTPSTVAPHGTPVAFDDSPSSIPTNSAEGNLLSVNPASSPLPLKNCSAESGEVGMQRRAAQNAFHRKSPTPHAFFFLMTDASCQARQPGTLQRTVPKRTQCDTRSLHQEGRTVTVGHELFQEVKDCKIRWDLVQNHICVVDSSSQHVSTLLAAHVLPLWQHLNVLCRGTLYIRA